MPGAERLERSALAAERQITAHEIDNVDRVFDSEFGVVE